MSSKIKVAAVSYLNTAPFVYGLRHCDAANLIDLQLDYPAECARKLLYNEVDVGLIPVFSILDKPQYQIVSDYCIGANGLVRTVSLLSSGSFNEITTIYLDSHSQTSVNLIKILAKHYWKREFEWKPLPTSITPKHIKRSEAMLAIGDKVFAFEPHFSLNIDLAFEWQAFTGLPMVFAVWASRGVLNEGVSKKLNQALAFGVENIAKSIGPYTNDRISQDDAFSYLTNNISFLFDNKKREALSLFWDYARKL
jgi:chorismate dehydratase